MNIPRKLLVRNAMDRKSGDDGGRADIKKAGTAGNGLSVSDYAAAHIPEGSVVDFVFYEDFNSDNINEAVIGITHFAPFPPESAVMLVQSDGKKLRHSWLSIADIRTAHECPALFDNAVAADTDGDGKPELVLSLFYGQEHDIAVSVFDWIDGELRQAWRSSGSYCYGSMETEDVDGDGISEIIIESGTHAGNEIIETNDTCYHVREACCFKWDGSRYVRRPYRVRMPYESYNLAVDFLKAVWLKDYSKAFNMVVLPGFLGLAGLDDSSLAAFKRYVSRRLRPALQKNIIKGKLAPLEPYDTCCQFSGPEDCFTVEMARVNGAVKIYSLEIAKNTLPEI